MFMKLVIVMLLFTGSKFSKGAVGGPDMLYCGYKMIRYNRTTHNCTNGQVQLKIFPTCGDPLLQKQYDENTHSCINNKIVEKSALWNVTTTVKRLPCGITKVSHRKKCCGDKIYDPRYQTCCVSKQELRIHDHKPEKKHVCCKLEAYQRRSVKATCHRSAHNDPFFRPKTLRRVNQKICKEFDNVYKVKVKSQVWNGNGRFLRVRVSRWTWRSLYSSRLLWKPARQKKHMRIKLDKYSGKKNLTGKMFLIFTDRKYSMKKVFRLRFREKVYSFPNNEILQKQILSKISMKCMKVLNRNKFSLSNG